MTLGAVGGRQLTAVSRHSLDVSVDLGWDEKVTLKESATCL